MSARTSILLVDDTPENLDVLSVILEDTGAQLLVATSGERALEITRNHLPDLILLDVMMPGMNGFDVCKCLKEQPATAEIPVIFVTARTEDISLGFQTGGADYITKPINADEVTARVSYQLERKFLLEELKSFNRALETKVRERTAELTLANRHLREEINERRYMQDRLNYLATHDFVTRLYNRNALENHVSETLARIQMDQTAASFLLLDIDRFRLVNESCGSVAGDELLRQFADSVSGLLARDDFLARIGGDRFVVVSSVNLEPKGLSLAHSILSYLHDFHFQWEEKQFNLEVSIGAVELNDSIFSFDQVMLLADETLYLAKQEGRGIVRTYIDAQSQKSNQRETINWASRLMDAIKQNSFRLFFQFVENIQSTATEDKRFRMEVLLRLWDSNNNRIIYPSEFIRPAERLHLIGKIDRWVVESTLYFFATNPDLLEKMELISINLSAISIRDLAFSQFIANKLKDYKFPAQKICFEITETEAIVNVESAKSFMRSLNDLGCHFALDDFGSGFASYAYLHQLAFDKIKIDGIFVRDMDTEPSHYAMVKSIVEMATSLKKEITAEFVEYASVSKVLQELGVHWVQGYYYHRPELLDAHHLQQYLLQKNVSS
jgi:diguanylate cyclase (GGDEF)-like protein